MFLFLNKTCVMGTQKESYQGDGSFEQSKHMFNLMNKKLIIILHLKSSHIWTYDKFHELYSTVKPVKNGHSKIDKTRI